MKTYTFADREEWLSARIGKITGSKLKDLIVKRGSGKKILFYQLIADRLGIPPDGETPMDRGHRLEEEAIMEFEKLTGLKVNSELMICERDDNPSIAYSPDGIIDGKTWIEIKCLGSARHIEALLTQEIPSDYQDQAIQAFVVNDDLKKLYMVFYDPRLLYKPLFWLEVKREDVKEKAEQYLEYQQATLAEVNEIVLKLSNF